MMKPLWMTLILALLGLCASAASAQDSGDPYAGIPMSRTADGAFTLGSADTRMTLIEFGDFLCTSCQNYQPIIKGFIRDYVATGQARLEHRIYPVVDARLSALSASLVECADDLLPGAFWRARDLMYAMTSAQGFTSATSVSFAAALGVEREELEACAEEAEQHAIDRAYGESLGARGTPSLFAQYGDAAPIQIALALPEHYPAIVGALRPSLGEVDEIEHGRYAGIQTFRREDGGLVLGDPDAPLTIVAFEDFLCPHCQNYQSTLHRFVEEQVRGGKAQLEFRFYPLVNPQYSTSTAQLAECVALQDLGLFWNAHDLLFEFASSGNLGALEENVAALLNLDGEALAACRDRAIQFLADTRLGQSADVRGTPALRARRDNGALDVIYAGGRVFDRGGAPFEVLSALADGSGDARVGAPEPSLLNPFHLEDDSLLTGIPCAPPCWRTITPGETRLSDAMETVTGMDGVAIAHSGADGFVFGRAGAEPCCQIASQDGQSATTILLQFAPSMAIGEVIARYGEPPFVTGQPFNADEAMLSFYYPQYKMLISAFTPGADGLLQESSPVLSALFSTEAVFARAFASEPFDSWKGYMTYGDYMDGEFDYQP